MFRLILFLCPVPIILAWVLDKAEYQVDPNHYFPRSEASREQIRDVREAFSSRFRKERYPVRQGCLSGRDI